jgi:sugar lactone lactonase YvrE
MCILFDRSILVCNSFSDDTKVLRFGPIAADGWSPFVSVFIRGGPSNPVLSHVYAVAVAPDGSIYCSNQGSSTVSRYAGLSAARPGAPLPLPPSLSQKSGIAPGVFLASSKQDPIGLHDVRGIAFGPDGLLYVADKGHGQVSAYDPTTGEEKKVVAKKKQGLKNPIQLVFANDGSSLFISDNGANCVWRVDLATRAVTNFVPRVQLPSALTVDGDRLLVGSRGAHNLISVRLTDGTVDSKPFIADLPDEPEFLLNVKGTHSSKTLSRLSSSPIDQPAL